MKKYFILFAVAAIFASCSNNATTETVEATDAVVETNFVALADIQAKGADFLDQEVKTSGIVDHVCKHGGKKVLLVGDGVDIHVFNDERFEEAIVGKEVMITGIMKEERTDEAALLKMEEDAINSHSEGEEAETRQERTIVYVNTMRDSLKNVGVDHFSEYYLDYVSHEENK